MPPRVNNSKPALLAALVLGLFWCVEGIDVNAPQVDRVLLLLTGLGLGWAALRDIPVAAAGSAAYAVLVAGVGAAAPRAASRRQRRPARDRGIARRRVRGRQSVHARAAEHEPGRFAVRVSARRAGLVCGAVCAFRGHHACRHLGGHRDRRGYRRRGLPRRHGRTWRSRRCSTRPGAPPASARSTARTTSPGRCSSCSRWSRWCSRSGKAAGRSGALVVSAVLFGWAIAFKQFAVLVLPPVVRYIAVRGAGWRRYALVVVGVVAAFVAPFFVRDPGAFLDKPDRRAHVPRRDLGRQHLEHTFATRRPDDAGTDVHGSFARRHARAGPPQPALAHPDASAPRRLPAPGS